MRALGYFRVDAYTQAFGETKTLVEFEQDFLDYCHTNVHQPIRTFGDLDPSGSGRYAQYQNLLTFINQSGSNFLVAIPDASHLGGDLETVARTFLEVEGTGAKVTCQDHDMPDPLQSALAVHGASGVSKSLSSKIRESMQDKALLGKALGRPPFGYRNGDEGSLVIVKEEAEVVELIFRLYTEDRLGMRRIVQRLNECGITTHIGGRWSVVSVRDILKNAVYIGTYARFGLRLPGNHAPIITRETYRAARDIVRERRPRPGLPRAEPFLLSGIVFCDYCGNRMMGVTRRQQWTNRDGIRNRNTYRYYQCQSRNNQSVCDYHTWRAAELEEAVLAQVPGVIRSGDLDRQSPDAVVRSSDETIRQIHKERERNAERRFLQAMRKTASGAANTDLLQEAVADLDRVRRSANRSEPTPDIDRILDQWDQIEFDEKRDFLLAHIGRAEVRDSMVTVVA